MRRLLLAVALVALVVGLAACGGHDGDATAKAESNANLRASASAGTPDAAAGAAVDGLVDAGIDQLKAGRTAAAKATFASVLESDPVNVYALYNLGLIAQQAGDSTTATTYYDAALGSDAGYAPALYNEAILLERTDLDRSVSLYRRAVAADPSMGPAYIRLGFALAHQGRAREAEKVRAQGLALDPTLAKAAAPSY
jgi:tetratricopeptide (TPR) repeat protein